MRGSHTFISTQNIDSGERWEKRISKELEKTNCAVLCVTEDNQDSPWLNYEAGSLGKIVDIARVIPYTLGFPPGEMQTNGPLRSFQGEQNDEDGTWRLIKSLNKLLPTPNEETFLREGFDRWWPSFKDAMYKALSSDPKVKKNRPTEFELLFEMRKDIQQLSNRVYRWSSADILAAVDIVDQTLRDRLTKLPNKRAFVERASFLTQSATPFVIVLFDLDDFKLVNDTMSHAKGDELLVQISATIKNQLQTADMIARVGGDVFAIIYCGIEPEAVVELIKDLLGELSNAAINAGFPAITASVGVSSYRIEPLDRKFSGAESAMFKAKTEGKGRIRISE